MVQWWIYLCYARQYCAKTASRATFYWCKRGCPKTHLCAAPENKGRCWINQKYAPKEQWWNELLNCKPLKEIKTDLMPSCGQLDKNIEFSFGRWHRIIKFKIHPKRLCKVFKCQWVKILTMRAHCLNKVKFHKEIPWIGLGRFIWTCLKISNYQSL